MNAELLKTIENLPEKPGVYFMKNEQGKIIYIGKALSLKSRVRSYFRSSHNHDIKVQAMVQKVSGVDYIVVDSDLEAFIMESNFIKRYKPYYNIRLKDDKHYPFVRIDVNEAFPKIKVVRRVENDGAKYFGPYLGATELRKTLDAALRIFGLRTCEKNLEKVPIGGRACLNAQVGRCMAPCQGGISKSEYLQQINIIKTFLSGRYDEILKNFRKQMEQASGQLAYEKAAKIRDMILFIENMMQKNKMILPGAADKDILGLAHLGDETVVEVFTMRNGKLQGAQTYPLEGAKDENDAAVISSFIVQHYQGSLIPKEILTHVMPDDEKTLMALLAEKSGRKVNVVCPQRGEKKKLVDMAMENAMQSLKKNMEKELYKKSRTDDALKAIQDIFSLKQLPRRIEGYDISNTQGVDSVGSMVVLEEGNAAPKQYRRFKIKTVEGANDFESIKEVVGRRFARAKAGDVGFEHLPDLILIDGGSIQLDFALQALKEQGYEIPIFGLAKRSEGIYLPGKETPILLPKQSSALHLLQQLRDEAHRFAVSYHRSLRSKKGLASMLQEIPGIGKTRRQAIFRHFRTMDAVRNATVEDLSGIDHMNKKAAQAIVDFFHGE